MAAGLVLVRQMPGSAKGVFVWSKLFERSRRVLLGSSVLAINGRTQLAGEVVHRLA